MVASVEMIRCPGCRGAKKVPKLGGMIGECNTCNGEGKIKECDKPVPVIVAEPVMVNDIINATSNVVANEPVVSAEPEPVLDQTKPVVRKVFKRKK